MPQFTNLVPRTPLLTADRVKLRHVPDVIRDMTVDGLFEGGGALGAAYVGGLRALHDNGIWFSRVAGNSAGAITAALIAGGFTAGELQWLSSGFDDAPPPPTLAARGITEPLDFMSFLDLPTLQTVAGRSMRKTQLWQALNGRIIDEIGKLPAPIPTRTEVAATCVDAISAIPVIGAPFVAAAGPGLRTVLRDALVLLPKDTLHLADFLPDSSAVRRTFADTVWRALAAASPALLAMTNLVHEGGLYEGRVFEETIGTLLRRRMRGNSSTEPVRMGDLPIPLAVVGANLDAKTMEVYTSRTHPTMLVAEAVRRSMSIPFFFEPCGARRQIVDGGVLANFPLFLFAGQNESYWPTGSGQAGRTVIGFGLDDTRKPQASWNAGPGRFELVGNPPRVDLAEVVRPILAQTLGDLGVPGVDIGLDLAEVFDGPPQPGGRRPLIEILQQGLGVGDSILGAEEITRSAVVRGLMADRAYVDVSVPLLGFHMLDFAVDGDGQALRDMWDRAWRSTVREIQLAKAKAPTVVLPAKTLTRTDSPFD